ncbi:MAG: hypothetical protein ACRDPC_03355 [Solirubrobacteraceae bacterium]
MPRSSVVRRAAPRSSARPALLAVAIAHEARVAAERAATARDVRHARAARRSAHAIAGALAELERLILADRAAGLAEQSRGNPLPVPGTVTPAERAWVLGWHLLAAAARLHGTASAGGRPSFGERETANAVALIRQGLCELQPLLASERRLQLRAALTNSAVSLDAQLRLFAPTLPSR